MTSLTVSESFKKRADSAAFFEAWVGSVLARAGLWTIHNPFTVAASGRDIPAYAHTWDLDVYASDPPSSRFEDRVSVEVKSIVQRFNRASDYPFDSVLVCSQKSFLKKWPGSETTRRDFLFVSRETGAILWLPIGTKVELGCEVLDKSRNELYKAVRAKKSDVRDLDEFVTYVYQGDAHGR